MKNLLACAVLALSLAGIAPASAQSASDLFQQGLRKERVDGDLKSAIAIYRRLIQEHPTDRSLVARALIQLGGAYERMGNADARTAYERVIREYPEQSSEASVARTRLAALSGGTGTIARTEPTVRRIWAGPGVDNLGAPTQDGRLLTFVDWSTGDLAVRDLVTGENRRLTNKGPWTKSVAFALSSIPSPDGKKVVYSWFNDREGVELRVAGMDGTDSRVVYSSDSKVEYLQPWDWSHDGKQILVYISRKDGTGQLALVGVADSSVHFLKALDQFDQWGPAKASLSPDGRYVAYDNSAGPDGQLHDIYMLRTDGGSPTTVVRHPAQDLLLGWTPDGKHIVFESDRTGNMSLWVLPIANGVASGEPELLRRDAEFTMVPMSINRDGTFYYSANASPTDLFTADVDQATGKILGKPRRLLDRYVGENRNADWSPDGSSIVYLSKRQPGPNSSTRILVVRSLATGNERIIPAKIGSLGNNTPHFTPDGRSIIIRGAGAGGHSGMFRVDLVSGEATLLLETGNGQYAGVTDGGNSLILLHRDFANGKTTAMLVRHSLTDSTQNDVYGFTGKRNQNIVDPVTSFDGNSIAFTHLDSMVSSIRVVSVKGGEPRELTRLPVGSQARYIAWSPDGRYVYYTQSRLITDRQGGMTSDTDHEPIMRVPVAGGIPEETGIVADEIQAIHISPDGKHITYTAGRSAWEVWVMENFLPKPSKRTAAGVK